MIGQTARRLRRSTLPATPRRIGHRKAGNDRSSNRQPVDMSIAETEPPKEAGDQNRRDPFPDIPPKNRALELSALFRKTPDDFRCDRRRDGAFALLSPDAL